MILQNKSWLTKMLSQGCQLPKSQPNRQIPISSHIFKLDFLNFASMFINISAKEPLHKILIKNVFFEIQHFEISERCISKNTFLINILCKGSLGAILMNMLVKF